MGFSAQAFDKSIMQDSSLVLHGVLYASNHSVKSYERCVVREDSIWGVECTMGGRNIHVKYYTFIPDSLSMLTLRVSRDNILCQDYIIYPVLNWAQDLMSAEYVPFVVTCDSISPFVYMVNVDIDAGEAIFDEYLTLPNIRVDLSLRTNYVLPDLHVEDVPIEGRNSVGFIDIPQNENVKYVRYFAFNGIELQHVVYNTPIVCNMYDADNYIVGRKVLLHSFK